MKNKIKLIATDFDGTVLDQGKYVNEKDVDAFFKIQKNGYKVIGVTGQPYFAAVRTANKFNFHNHFDLIASDNGAFIAKVSEHHIYHSLGIEHEVIDQLNKVLMDESDTFFFYSSSESNTVYVNHDEDEAALKKSVWFESDCAWARIKDIKDDEIIHQATIICNQEDSEAVDNILVNHKSSVAWSYDVKDEKCFYSVNNIEATKASALKFVADKFGFKLDEILIFGDGPNDIPMFELIENSVAPANAVDEIKNIASHQTDSMLDGGVGNFIRKHFLEEE